MILGLEIQTELINFSEVVFAISQDGGDLVAIDVIQTTKYRSVRDLTVNVADFIDTNRIVETIKNLKGVKLINISDCTFVLHLGGKIKTKLKVPIQNRDDLSRVYTLDVSRVCMTIHEDRGKAFSLTIKRNIIAVVSGGIAVLGWGTMVLMQLCLLWREKRCCLSRLPILTPFLYVSICRIQKRSYDRSN